MAPDGARRLRAAFARLHEADLFLMPNPWDVGSALILVSLGFPALATTSSGHAETLGRLDHTVTRDELLRHVSLLAGEVEVPLNVDSERCFADTPAGVAETVHLIVEAGAAGCSIEDYDHASRSIEPVGKAAERVAAAAETAHAHELVLTARAENHVYGAGDLDDTIERLQTYRAAGADVLYAPGLRRLGDIARVVREVDGPVNVLAWPGGPTVSELRSAGVRRVSPGGALAKAAYGALVTGARELLEDGTSSYALLGISNAQLVAAFRDD